MKIDKDLVQKAVDEVVSNLNNEFNNEDPDLIYSDEEEKKNEKTDVDDTNTDSPMEDHENINEDDNDEEDVEEKVTDKIEEEVEEYPNFNFLGLDINVEKTEDGKFNVKFVRDEKEKVEVLDSLDLDLIFNLVEEFFNELVLEEPNDFEESEDNEFEGKTLQQLEDLLEHHKEDMENADDDCKEEYAKEIEEIEDAIAKLKDDEDNDLSDSFEENEEDGIYTSMASLRTEYSDDVEKIFNHGLMAKKIALDMIRENITAKTVKELGDKFKKNDQIIASKKQELKKVSVNYLMAKKFENNLKKSVSILAASIEDLKKKIKTNSITSSIAKQAIDRYKTIISDVVSAKDVDAIIATTNKINKLNKAIVANVNKNKVKNDNVNKKEIKFNKSRNVYNRTGRTDNKSLLSNKRYDSIDEMSAEILRIAGIDE